MAIFCDIGAVELNGNTTATTVASPMIQPKKTRGYGVESSSRYMSAVATSAHAAAANTYPTVGGVTPGAFAARGQDRDVEQPAAYEDPDQRDERRDHRGRDATRPQRPGVESAPGLRLRILPGHRNCHHSARLVLRNPVSYEPNPTAPFRNLRSSKWG